MLINQGVWCLHNPRVPPYVLRHCNLLPIDRHCPVVGSNPWLLGWLSHHLKNVFQRLTTFPQLWLSVPLPTQASTLGSGLTLPFSPVTFFLLILFIFISILESFESYSSSVQREPQSTSLNRHSGLQLGNESSLFLLFQIYSNHALQISTISLLTPSPPSCI